MDYFNAAPLGELEQDIRRFHAEIKRLQGRISEGERYRRSVIGRSVSWIGKVGLVGTMNTVKGELVRVGLQLPDPGGGWGAFAHFPKDFDAGLYGLKKGDCVRVNGVIDTTIADIPTLEATSFELL